MRRNSKSPEEAKAIGGNMRREREKLKLVLEDIQAATGVNVGQLSRFERGEFRMNSGNLQKVLAFLQIESGKNQVNEELVARFTKVVAKSRRHEVAAVAIVAALEALA